MKLFPYTILFNNTVCSFVDIIIEAPIRPSNFILSPLFKIVKVFKWYAFDKDIKRFCNKVT